MVKWTCSYPMQKQATCKPTLKETLNETPEVSTTLSPTHSLSSISMSGPLLTSEPLRSFSLFWSLFSRKLCGLSPLPDIKSSGLYLYFTFSVNLLLEAPSKVYKPLYTHHFLSSSPYNFLLTIEYMMYLTYLLPVSPSIIQWYLCEDRIFLCLVYCWCWNSAWHQADVPDIFINK